MKKCILFLTLALIFLCIINHAPVRAGKVVAVFPFYDDSGYNGPWDLRNEVPEMLGDMLIDDYFHVIPMDSVIATMPKPPVKGIITKFFDLFRNEKRPQKMMSDLEILVIAHKLDADYAVTGIIDNFKFRRQGAGDVIVGGYKSYLSDVEFSHVRVLRVIDGTMLGMVKGDSEKSEKGLGVELLGKPRKRDMELYSLDSIDFGSKRFLRTMIGETAVEALNKVHTEVRAILALPDTAWFTQKKFRIVSIDGGVANINAGSADGISPGERFNVYASESGVLVGKINIITVWADHISKAEILQGKDEIRADDIIMPER
jgi:hypothetical protein